MMKGNCLNGAVACFVKACDLTAQSPQPTEEVSVVILTLYLLSAVLFFSAMRYE